jgi:hypothetical protein
MSLPLFVRRAPCAVCGAWVCGAWSRRYVPGQYVRGASAGEGSPVGVRGGGSLRRSHGRSHQSFADVTRTWLETLVGAGNPPGWGSRGPGPAGCPFGAPRSQGRARCVSDRFHRAFRRRCHGYVRRCFHRAFRRHFRRTFAARRRRLRRGFAARSSAHGEFHPGCHGRRFPGAFRRRVRGNRDAVRVSPAAGVLRPRRVRRRPGRRRTACWGPASAARVRRFPPRRAARRSPRTPRTTPAACPA